MSTEALAPALQAAVNDPARDELWEAAEAEARALQHPDDVTAAYKSALTREPPLTSEVADAVAHRALAFYDEWSGDADGLVGLLNTVLSAVPDAVWAFERLSMTLTVGERWDDLLALYDRALARSTDDARRAVLLDEAANVARDFASQPARAIGYLQQLFVLDPSDAQVARSLERLYERSGRHRDLVTLWTSRLPHLAPDAARNACARIAGTWLDPLGDPAEALTATEALAAVGASSAEVCGLLERIAVHAAAAPVTVRRAVESLCDRYDTAKRPADAVRVLGLALRAADDNADRANVHREIAVRLLATGDERTAVDHLAALVVLTPADPLPREQLEALALRTGRQDSLAEALASAADVADATDPALAAALRVRAADVRCDVLQDGPGAVALYTRVLAAEGHSPREVLLAVARRMESLLEGEGRAAERLDVLESLAAWEPAPDDRRAALGRAAWLAVKLGDADRALRQWALRLADDAGDREALDARVDILAGAGRWEALVAALTGRAAMQDDPVARRGDLVRVATVLAQDLADIPRAIQAWTAVRDVFGEDATTVDSLADLYTTAGMWKDLLALLGRAAGEASGARRAELLVRAGDTHRAHLNDPVSAIGVYRTALEADPASTTARAGAVALLALAPCRAEAVDALTRAYAMTDAWELTLSLVEHRVDVASDAGTQALVLMEAADLREHRAGDAAGALNDVARALPLAVGDDLGAEVESELARLAERTGAWAVAVAAYDAAIRGTEGDLAAALSYRQGQILDSRVRDGARALGAYGRAAAHDPSDVDAALAVVRTAGSITRWEAAAGAFVASVRARRNVHPSLVMAMEAAAQQVEAGWDGVALALESAVAAARGDLAPAELRTMETLAATWHRDRRVDSAAAEAALLRAVADDPGDAPTLGMLADIQRGAPGMPLVRTLQALAETVPEDLDALHEAAELALGPVNHREIARGILTQLLERAAGQWQRGDALGDDPRRQSYASWSLRALVDGYVADGDHRRAVELLVAGAKLPFDAETARAMRHEAAERAAGPLGDAERAVRLYTVILDESPGDLLAIDKLAGLYEASGRMDELVALRRRELGLATEPARRLALRLELARILVVLGDGAGREKALRENLAEAPGHGPSVEALAGLLATEAREAELVDLLAEQAARLESRGGSDTPLTDRTAHAAALWGRAAVLAETALGDIPRAVACHERVVALAEVSASLDALARLYTARGEHQAAVGYLERRLAAAGGAPQADRAGVVVALARAHMATERTELARSVLEDALAVDPDAGEVRGLLAGIYRAEESWEPLAQLLMAGAQRADDAARMAALREAAEVLHRRLGAPERAVPVLEEAMALAPDDRGVKLALADARRMAGQMDGAREILDALVEAYGRQRPPERAAAHYQLAQIAHARGHDAEALAQLEMASTMDMGHVGIFKMLGDLSRDAGHLERAERAYRALLLVVRRNAVAARDNDEVGPSEVLYEIHGIAVRLGQGERAKEVLESAFEAAGRSVVEMRRLERALRGAGQPELLLRALEARAALETDPVRAAAAYGDMADVLADALDRPEESLTVRLRALGFAPDDSSQHDATRTLARQVGQSERYASALVDLTAKARERGEAGLAAALLLRLGAMVEEDLADPRRAAVIYAEAEETGEALTAVWRALDRVYGLLDDTAGQARVLRQLIDGEDDEHGPEARVDALYRLGAIQVMSDDSATRDEGIDWLTTALDRDPAYARVAVMLQRATEHAPGHDALLALYERVARELGDSTVLLDALSRCAALPDATMEALREAVDIARALDDDARAEVLLTRAVDLARPRGLSEAVWALEALAERRKALGDIAGAVGHLREAAEAADGLEAFHLGLEVANLAAGSLGDLRLAAETYEKLRARDPSEQRVWEPLLEVYRMLSDDAALERLIDETVGSVFDQATRAQLRMERARLLLRDPNRIDDAAQGLRDVLDEDPDNDTATKLLADLLERAGRTEDLADLLVRQFDAARDRRDADAAVLGLRLAALYAPHRRDHALDVLRSALDVFPEDRGLLRTFVGTLGPEDDPGERATAAERLLGLEAGGDAAVLAEHLAALREVLEDDEGVERALEAGFRAQPTHTGLRDRLHGRYTAREDYPKLAALQALDAMHRTDPGERARGLRDAATLHRDRLAQPAVAAEMLKRARADLPGDTDILADYVRSMAAAGERDLAVAELTDALVGAPDTTRVELLRLRAGLRGDDDSAVADLEAAYELAPDAVAGDLAAALDRLRATAARSEDARSERAATLRLADVLPRAGRAEMGFALLAEWIESHPTDRDALRRLAELNVAIERWDAAVTAFHKLVLAEEGPQRTDAALRLAEACEKAGRLHDAREGLERAYAGARESEDLRGRLRKLYEAAEAYRELAGLWTDEAEHATDDTVKFDRLKKSGEVWLDLVGDVEEAITVLERAAALKPADHDVTVLLADALTAAERFKEVSELLNEAIAVHKGRRSRELSVLQHRMGRLAYAAGDHQVEMAWLNVALDTDPQNGQVAAELADVAMELQQYDGALKALRAVTLMKTPGPMTRAVAFLKQGEIAHKQGDPKKAVFFARKALSEDPNLTDAQKFIDEVGAE